MRYAFLDHPGPIPFVHRGSTAGHTENTIAAFASSRAMGFRYIETDVRTTRDGKLVVLHDRKLGRVFGVDVDIRSLNWKDLAAIGDRVVEIPLLADALDNFPDMRFNVDLKDWPAVDALARVITWTASIDRICAASFSEARLARIRRILGRRLCTSTGVSGTLKFALPFPRRLTDVGQGAAIQMPYRLGRVQITRPHIIAKAKRRDLRYHVWTLDDEESIIQALEWGVDGIMTDRPDVLKSVMTRLGLWH